MIASALQYINGTSHDRKRIRVLSGVLTIATGVLCITLKSSLAAESQQYVSTKRQVELRRELKEIANKTEPFARHLSVAPPSIRSNQAAIESTAKAQIRASQRIAPNINLSRQNVFDGTLLIDLFSRIGVDDQGNLLWNGDRVLVTEKSMVTKTQTAVRRSEGATYSIAVDSPRHGGGSAPSAQRSQTMIHSHADDEGGGQLNINAATKGVLNTSRGGTGFSGFASGDLIIGNDANGLNILSLGSSGQVLTVTNGSVQWKEIVSSARSDTGTGNVIIIGDSRYVRKSGDTMTGSLILTSRGSYTGAVLLSILGVASGTHLHAESTLTSSGSISAVGSITTKGVLSGATLTIQNSATISGSLLVKTSIVSKGGLSGSTVMGLGLGACSGPNQAVNYNSSTHQFSCVTLSFTATLGTGNVIAVGDTRYLKRSGGTMTGQVVVDITSGGLGSVGLRVMNTFSGAIIHAEKSLSASGNLVIAGNGYFKGSLSGATIGGIGLSSCNSLLQKVLFNSSTGKFECGSDRIGTDTGNVLALGDTRYVRKSGDTMTGSLSVRATMSGLSLVVSRSATVSGSLLVKNGISSKGSLSGVTIAGFSLGSCNAATQRLLYNNATQKFECGTNSTSAFGTGNVLTISDARFLKRSGGTMTGQVVVDITNGNLNSIGLKVINTLSGAHLHAERNLTSSGTITSARRIAVAPGTAAYTSTIGWTGAGSTSGFEYYNGIEVLVGNEYLAQFASNAGLKIGSSRYFGWSGNSNDAGSAVQTALYSSIAGVIEQRNGTNAQSFNVFNTYTSSTNNEGLRTKGVANANFEIGPFNGGAGGVLRGLTIGGYLNGGSSIAPWLTFTNSGAATFANTVSGARLSISSNANISGSLLVKSSITTRGTVSGATVVGTNGITTKVFNGPCADGIAQPSDGTICIDSNNGRIYFRYGGSWHYSAQTAGFQIPKIIRNGRDETEGLSPGDVVVGLVDERLDDGAMHGVWKKFDLESELRTLVTSRPDIFSSQIDRAVALPASEVLRSEHEGDLKILGSVTISEDLTVNGRLTVGSNQAGLTTIPAGNTGASVQFELPWPTAPIVSVTPDWPVTVAVAERTREGFRVILSEPAPRDITVSWFALTYQTGGRSRETTVHVVESSIVETAASIPFYVDEQGVPLTDNEILNGCIRGVVPLDADGMPYACNRYHDGFVWDTGKQTFIWNTHHDPPLLEVPDGYRVVHRPKAESTVTEVENTQAVEKKMDGSDQGTTTDTGASLVSDSAR